MIFSVKSGRPAISHSRAGNKEMRDPCLIIDAVWRITIRADKERPVGSGDRMKDGRPIKPSNQRNSTGQDWDHSMKMEVASSVSATFRLSASARFGCVWLRPKTPTARRPHTHKKMSPTSAAGPAA